MKTYWANFVKTGDPNTRGIATFVSLRPQRTELPFWPHFNFGNQKVQSLTPPGPLSPQGSNPFNTFGSDHFCGTWEPLLTFNNGNEPEQP